MNKAYLVSALLLLALLGCESPLGTRPEPEVASSIRHYGCNTCHNIPGIAGADANVGPPLNHFGNRTYIAGVLPNNTDNLSRWIQHPQQIHPGTAMPEMQVSSDDARKISRYLESLH